MKLKLTVLTLLLLGLVFAGNAFAVQTATLSLVARDDTIQQIPVLTVDTIGYPVLRLRLTNTGEAVTLTSLTLKEGTNAAGSAKITHSTDFTLSVWQDKNSNGVLDAADGSPLNAAPVQMLVTHVPTVVPIDAGLALAVGAIKDFIVIANAGVADLAVDDAVELRVDTGVGNQPFGGIAVGGVISTTDTTKNPMNYLNNPVFVVVNDDGALAQAASVVLSTVNVGNFAKDRVVAAFKLKADDNVAHVLNSVTISDGDWTTPLDVAEDISSMSLYLDSGTTVGALDVNDVLLINDITDPADFVTNLFDLKTLKRPVFIAKGATKNFIITVNATGLAGVSGAVTADTAKEIIAVDVAEVGIAADDNLNATGAYAGPAIGLTPLVVTKVETKDADHDGALDALKLTFSAPINDSRWNGLLINATPLTDSDLIVYGRAPGNAFIISAFNPTAYGDVAGNNVVYVQFPSANIPAAQKYTNGLPVISLQLSAANSILSGDGTMAMIPFKSKLGDGDAVNNLAIDTVDKAEPVVMGTSVQDANSNGKIDRAIVTFSEPMKADNDKCWPNVKFATTITTFGVSGVYSATSGVVSGNTVTYTIGESAATIYDTESVPKFNYNPASPGDLKDAATVGVEVLAYNSTGGLVQPSDTIDDAPPAIISVKTGDNWTDERFEGGTLMEASGPNGRLDTMVFTFSEAVTTVNYEDDEDTFDDFMDNFTIADANDVGLIQYLKADAEEDDAPYSPEPTLSVSGTTDTNGILTIYVKERSHGDVSMVNGGDTGELYQYMYILDVDSDNNFTDPNGNVMLAIGALTAASDGARPFIVDGQYRKDGITARYIYTAGIDSTAELGGWAGNKFANVLTVDSNMTDMEIGDGYIDAFHIFISETVHITTAANPSQWFTVANGSNSTITLDVGIDADASGTVTTADNNYDFTDAVVYGTSSKKSGKYDTGATPTVNFNRSGSGVQIYDYSGVNYLNDTGDIKSYDTAKPVPVYAIGNVGAKTISVTWSEDVFSADDGVTQVFGASNAVFGYDNVSAADAGALGTTAITYASKVMVIQTSANLTSADVAADLIWVKYDDKVFDDADSDGDFLALTENKAAFDPTGTGYEFGFNDDIAPTITDAWTLDVDGDGLVDYIRIEFSEEILDSSLQIVYNPNELTISLASQWVLSDYTGTAKFNLYADNDASKEKAAILNHPIFADNLPNDEVLYMALQENKVPMTVDGTTGWAPTLTLVNCELTDKKPNPLATTSFNVEDKAGPALMIARTLTTRILEVGFSEDVDLETVQSGDFSWTLGGALENFQVNVATVIPSVYTPGRIVLETIEGFAWEPYMGGTISYVAHPSGGVKPSLLGIEDLEGNISEYSDTDAYGNAVWYKTGHVVDDTKGLVAEYVEISTDDIVVNVEEAAAPVAYALSKNYPNPFNPTTTIEFAIPVAGNVELVIYNINGQKVRTLVSETKDAGYYKAMWDGRNELGESVSSGIYLYRLVSGDFSKIEKMTFIK